MNNEQTAVPGSEITAYTGAGQVAEYRARLVMTPDDARELDAQLRACTLAVLREGTDYGTIPGTDGRNVLFKPGAEKLLQWFGLSFTCDRRDIDYDGDGRREGVTYRAAVHKRLPDGQVVTVATCDGYAGYDEDKFFQTAEQAQFKAEAKERYWAAKDRRVANPNKWKHLTEYRAPWNTILKMAQKRAIVGAAIDATAAAGLFTADDDSGSDAPADGGADGGDGPSWYRQALGDAAVLTDVEAGRKLYADAARAARDGLCTPGQATHVQNRIDSRIRHLQDSGAREPVRGTVVPEDVPHAETAPGSPPAGQRSAGGTGRRKAASGKVPSAPESPQGADGTPDPTAPENGRTSGSSPASASAAASGSPADPAPGSGEYKSALKTAQAQFGRILGRNAEESARIFGREVSDDEVRSARLDYAVRILGGGFDLQSMSELAHGDLAKIGEVLAKCKDRAALDTLLDSGVMAAEEAARDGEVPGGE